MARRSSRTEDAPTTHGTGARSEGASEAPSVRRRWTLEQKRQIVAAAAQPGMSVAMVARKHGISTGQFYAWRQRLVLDGAADGTTKSMGDRVVVTRLSSDVAAPQADSVRIVARFDVPEPAGDDTGAADAPTTNRTSVHNGFTAAPADRRPITRFPDAALSCVPASPLRRFCQWDRSAAGRSPVPGQHLLELVRLGVAGDDALQHVGQPGEWLDAVQLRRVDQRHGDRPVLGGAIAAGEQGVFSCNRDRTHAALDHVGMCALPRCTVLPGGNPGRQTLAPAGSTRSGPGGDEWSEALREKAP